MDSERASQECPRCCGDCTVPEIIYNQDGTNCGQWTGYENWCPRCGGKGIVHGEAQDG